MATALLWLDRQVTVEMREKTVKALRKAGNYVLKETRPEVPVSTEVRSPYRKGKYPGKAWTSRYPGTLKRSGRVYITRKRNKAQVIFGGRSSKSLTAYYAHFVEFGVVRKGRPIAGRIFLRKTFTRLSNGILDCFNNP